MDQGSLLDDFAQVRRQVITLCSSNRFSAAQMLLVGSGHSPSQMPGLWEHIARKAAEAGHDPIAQEIRRQITAAGGQHERLTLDEAAFLLKNGDYQNSIFVVEGYFGTTPDHPEALELLTRAYMQEATGRRNGTRLRTSQEAALRLTEGVTPISERHAMAAIDLLRYSGEYDRALAMNMRAIKQFPDDVRFLMRRARMDEQKGKFDTAIPIWVQVAERSERYRIEALFRLRTLYQKLERFPEAEAIAAQLLSSDLPIDRRVILAIQIGQRPLVLAILRALSSSQLVVEELSFDQGRAIGDALLDNGEIGLLVWLRRRRIPLSDRVKQVLDHCAFGEPDGPELPDRFETACKIRSPEFMLPLEDFAGLLPKPPGWPGRRRDPGRILLVNSSLKTGGAERQFVALAKALLDAGTHPEELHVALFSVEADRGMDAFLPDLEALGITIHNLGTTEIDNPTLPANIERVISALPYDLRQDVTPLWHLLSKLKPNVVHAWQDRSCAACGIAGKLTEVESLVLSMRNMSPQTRRDSKLAETRPLIASLAKQDNVTITANAAAAVQDYADWLSLDGDTVQALRNIVDVDHFAPVREAYISRQTNAAITIGGAFRLALNKRPLLWLQTVAALKSRLDVPLVPVLFGSGPMFDQVTQEADRLGITDLKVITGETDPLKIYKELDLLLLMSRVEGLPNVLLEAQAGGIPVAACDVGGVNETLQKRGDAGALLLPEDVSAENAADQIAHWLPTARAAPIDPRIGFIRKNYGAEAVIRPLIDTYCGRRAEQ